MTVKQPYIDISEKNLDMSWMLLLSFFVGIFAGFGSILFKAMIGLVHNLAFDGHFSIHFDANLHPVKSVWGIGIIFVPVLGAVIVTWLTQTFAPEAKGHGVPEVMNAIHYREGKIRPIVAIVKSIASSISIGTGGSVGREGPIIQIGSAFASLLGQLVRVSTRQRVVLIAAGAAAGITATFNTPIGGLAFAIELMLVTINATNVIIVAIATVTATMISNLLDGVAPSFSIAHLDLPFMHALNPWLLLTFIPFGIIAGGVAALFIHSIYWFEDRAAELVQNPYIRHMLGMFVLGIALYLMMRYTGEYYISGVGYSTIIDILMGVLTNPLFLLSLCILKILATSLTLGSGASGGVFSPSLFIGATLGAAYGSVISFLFPSLHIPVILFSIAGMAAIVGGSTGAVLTAIAMTFEQTRDYADILPIILSVAITYAVRVRITTESIYTLKLRRRGLPLPQGLQAAISVTKQAADFMERKFAVIDLEQVSEFIQKRSHDNNPQYALVVADGKIIGAMGREVNYLVSGVDVEQVIDKSFIVLPEKTTWPVVLRKMNHANAAIVLVSKKSDASASPENIIGIITQHEVFKSSQALAKLL